MTSRVGDVNRVKRWPRSRVAEEQGIDDILLIGGGVIPEKDKKLLEKEGITGNFGPGTPLTTIINHINSNLKKKREI